MATSKQHLTNADRIRAMTDGELGGFLWNRDIGIVKKAAKAAGFTFTFNEEECLKELLDWLKQEVDDGD